MINNIITNENIIRKESCIRACNTYNISYKFHSFQRNLKDGVLGCLSSHIALWNYANDNNMDYIWISEDNITNSNSTIPNTILNELNQFLKEDDWKVIYLGGWFLPICSYSPTKFNHIFQTNNIHGASSYIIHRRLYKTLLELLNNNMNRESDTHIYENSINQSYIIYPLLFYRNNKLKSTTSSFFLTNTLNSIFHNPNFLKYHESLIRYGWCKPHIIFLVLCVIILFILLFFIKKKKLLFLLILLCILCILFIK